MPGPTVEWRQRMLPMIAGGLLVLALGLVWLSAVEPTGTFVVDVLPASLVAALGMSLAYIPAMMAAMSGAPAEQAGLASGVVNTFHEVGGSIGVAVVSTVAATGIERGTAGGFTDASTVCAVAAAVSAAAALGLVPRGKPQMTGAPYVH